MAELKEIYTEKFIPISVESRLIQHVIEDSRNDEILSTKGDFLNILQKLWESNILAFRLEKLQNRGESAGITVRKASSDMPGHPRFPFFDAMPSKVRDEHSRLLHEMRKSVHEMVRVPESSRQHISPNSQRKRSSIKNINFEPHGAVGVMPHSNLHPSSELQDLSLPAEPDLSLCFFAAKGERLTNTREKRSDRYRHFIGKLSLQRASSKQLSRLAEFIHSVKAMHLTTHMRIPRRTYVYAAQGHGVLRDCRKVMSWMNDMPLGNFILSFQQKKVGGQVESDRSHCSSDEDCSSLVEY